MPFENCDSTCEMILKNGFPIAGFITALLINISPWVAVTGIMNNRSLGSVNTFPFPMMVANATSWMLYGLYVKDIYVFSPNVFGMAFGLYYTFATFPYQTALSQKNSMIIIIVAFTIEFIAAAVTFLYITEIQIGQKVLGVVCVTVLIIFYSSPLSTMAYVIKTKDATSVHLLLAVASLLNGVLWSVYGLVVNDWFVAGPNLLGSLFAILQLVLLAIYRKPQGISTSIEVLLPPEHRS